MSNLIKVQLLEEGKVVREIETENTVFDYAKYIGQYLQAVATGMPNNSAIPSLPQPQANMTINLWDNTTTIEENMYPILNNGL